MFKNITFSVLMFCSCLSFAQDATGLSLNVPCPSSTVVAVGERICLDFQVSDFSRLAGIQFQTEWNSTVFSFESVSVDTSIRETIEFDESFVVSTELGKLKVAGWSTSDFLEGSSLPDESILFTACFVAEAAGAANFRISGMGIEPEFPIEVFDVDLNMLAFLPTVCTEIEVTNDPIDPVIPIDTMDTVDPIDPVIPVDTMDTVDPIDPVDPVDPNEVIVNISSGTANVGEDFCVDVTVEGFTNLLSIQFGIIWDTTFLSFKEHTDFALPNAASSLSVLSDNLRLAWITDDFVNGFTIEEGEKLFSICFTALRDGTNTLIIDEVAITAEALQVPEELIEVIFQVGTITVNGQDCSFQIDLASTDVSCSDFSDGSISTIPDGAASDFIYAWSTGESGPEINDLSAGTYILTVTDGEGCMITREVSILEPNPLVLAVAEESTSSCFSSIVINAGGGVGPYEFSLNEGDSQSEALFTNLGSGTYSVLITDANGCTQVEGVTIGEKEEVGTTCDDEDENTRNDVITEDCECKGKTEEELNCPTIESEVSRSICEGQSSEGYTESGIFTDTFQAANGCDSVRILSLMLVDRIVTEIDATICEGDTISGYFERGSYIDIFSSVDGCDSLRILSLFVFSESDANCLPTATIDIDKDDAIQVAPNPVANDLNIEISNSSYLPATVTIYGIHGNLVDRHIINSPQQTIPMGNKNSGMYVLILETPDAQFIKRIVKQ